MILLWKVGTVSLKKKHYITIKSLDEYIHLVEDWLDEYIHLVEDWIIFYNTKRLKNRKPKPPIN